MDPLEGLSGPGTVVACVGGGPADPNERLAATTLHRVNAETGDEWGQAI
jgi:hypothetical protein